MEEYCENPLCRNKSVKEVPVSAGEPGVRKRALCAACEKAYSWGIQHGRFSGRKRQMWVLAIADKGLIACARTFSNKKDAAKALAEYLRCNEYYNGPDDISGVWDWLAEHDERLSVELCSSPLI